MLGPAIVRKIAANDRASIAEQVRQVTYWIIAAQLGIALALGNPGRAVMGLVGSDFTGGTAMLGFLLAAEVIAATAVVSESALIYLARKRNMVISLIMLAVEAGLAAALILIMRGEDLPWPSRRPGRRSRCAWRSAFASIAKSWLLAKELGAPVSGWRWDLAWATRPGVAVGARGPAVPAADAAAGRRRAGDPRRLLRGAVDQGVHARDRELFTHAQARGRASCARRKMPRWPAIRSATIDRTSAGSAACR